MTIPAAVSSRAPSRPPKASMSAVSRPAGPAGYTDRPSGTPCCAAAATASAVATRSSPFTSAPSTTVTSGTNWAAAVPSSENVGGVSAVASTPGIAAIAVEFAAIAALSSSVSPDSRT